VNQDLDHLTGADAAGSATDDGSGPGQRDGLLRARLDALAAGLAGRGIRRERLLPAVPEALELAAPRQRRPLGRWQHANGEHLYGAHGDAGSLPFAAIAINHGDHHAGSLLAAGVEVVIIHRASVHRAPLRPGATIQRCDDGVALPPECTLRVQPISLARPPSERQPR